MKHNLKNSEGINLRPMVYFMDDKEGDVTDALNFWLGENAPYIYSYKLHFLNTGSKTIRVMIEYTIEASNEEAYNMVKNVWER